MLSDKNLELEFILQNPEYQTEELCLKAVKHNGYALEYVCNNILTKNICLEAVKQNGGALKYLYFRNEYSMDKEICLEAVKQCGYALQHVIEQTEEICLEAVKQNGLALQLVDIKYQTNDICLEAVKQNGLSLKYVRKKRKEICLEGVKQNIRSLAYVNIKYAKYILNILKSKQLYDINDKINYDKVNFIINMNIIKFKDLLNIIENKYKFLWLIKYIKQNLDIFKFIVNISKSHGIRYHLTSRILPHINYKKIKLCLQIIKTLNNRLTYNKKIFKYINKQYIEILL